MMKISILGAVQEISDWYLPENDPMSGYVYPGGQQIIDDRRLVDASIILLESCLRHVEEDSDYQEFVVKEEEFLYRGHVIESVDGKVFVLRRIATFVPDLDTLGLGDTMKTILLHERLGSGGLVLICGETGQGKSTTCSAAIKARLEKFGNFALTVEDPPEFPLHGLHGQKGRCIQTKVRRGDFASALSGAMRCYPAQSGSILYVGETRDAETASEVLRIATNGHLVFTTVHGTDIQSSLRRLMALATAGMMGNESEVKATLAASLRLIVHQHLREYPSRRHTDTGNGKKLETSFLFSADASTPVANRIRTNVDLLSSDIQQQKMTLESKGIRALLEMWGV